VSLATGDAAAHRMIPWETLRGVNAQHGDAFYLFDPAAFQRNWDDLAAPFQARYANTRLAYSSKANYLPQICQLAARMEGHVEVASRMEYDLVRHAGVPPSQIIVNGPGKREGEIEEALLAGALVNLDAPGELDVVERIVQRHPRARLRVGLRCNFDLGDGRPSRFGFDADGTDLAAAFHRLEGVRPALVSGLHCHAVMPGYAAAPYGVMMQRLVATAKQLFGDRSPEFLDIGGGFCSRMPPELARQFGHDLPSFEDYAAAIAPHMAGAYAASGGPTLLLEPGLALTADVMQFVARVVDVKTIRSRRIAVVAGSIFDIRPTGHDKRLPASIVPAPAGPNRRTAKAPVDIVGHTCLEGDCLYAAFPDAVSVGDYLVVGNVGAYTSVRRPAFIHPHPAVVSLDLERGTAERLTPAAAASGQR